MPRIGLFPGQGAQGVGMLRHCFNTDPGKTICELAASTLGYDIASLCEVGPADKLNRTVYCQPATLLSSLTSYAKCKRKLPPLDYLSGFSVGEIAALAVSGSISYRDAFVFVKCRAEAMEYASNLSPSGMLYVTGVNTELVQEELDSFNRERLSDYDAVIANYLTQNICSISVGLKDMTRLIERLESRKAKRITRIPVSGAFHSEFMSPATEKITQVTDQIDISLPSIPTFSNITGKPYESVIEIRKALPLQMTRPVLWHTIMDRLLSLDSRPEFVELGYGGQLSAILARRDRSAFQRCVQIP